MATLRAFYANAPRVLYRHQQIAFDALGLVRFEAETRVILYERHFVLPAPRAVGELAKRTRDTVERDVTVAIEREISAATRARWVEQLFESRADGMPCIEFLQEPPGSLNPSSITREAEKVRTLLDMNVAECATSGHLGLPNARSHGGVSNW